MELRSYILTAIITMSIHAAPAWGRSLDEASWRAQILNACAETYATRLERGRIALAPESRENLAHAVCSDGRVFWSFVEAHRADADRLEAKWRRAHENEEGPIVIGLRGASALDTSTALHALRDLLYVNSDTLLEWTRNARLVKQWAADPEGGAWGGLVFVNLDGASEADVRYKRERFHEAYAYMSANGMSASLLAITSTNQADLGDAPIHWANLEAAPCAASL